MQWSANSSARMGTGMQCGDVDIRERLSWDSGACRHDMRISLSVADGRTPQEDLARREKPSRTPAKAPAAPASTWPDLPKLRRRQAALHLATLR